MPRKIDHWLKKAAQTAQHLHQAVAHQNWDLVREVATDLEKQSAPEPEPKAPDED